MVEELTEQPKIVISTPSAEDAVGIQNVFYQTWLDTYPNEEVGITRDDVEDRFKDSFSAEILQQRTENLLNPPSGQKFLVAKVGSEVVGVCRVQRGNNSHELQGLYVLPEYQGQGVGKLLWQEALEFLGTDKDIFVRAASYNKQAISFYEKLGFKSTGRQFSEERFKMKSGNIIPEIEMVLKASEIN